MRHITLGFRERLGVADTTAPACKHFGNKKMKKETFFSGAHGLILFVQVDLIQPIVGH